MVPSSLSEHVFRRRPWLTHHCLVNAACSAVRALPAAKHGSRAAASSLPREAGCSQVARWALGGTHREVRRSSGREGKLMGDFRHRGGKRSAGCEPMD